MLKKRLAFMVLAVGLVLTLFTGCDIWVLILNDGLGWDTDSDLTISVEWNHEVDDVDLFVTYPKPNVGGDVFYTDVPAYVEIDDSYALGVASGYTGFFPEDGSSRESVYAGGRHDSTFDGANGPAVELTLTDSNGGGPETVVVREVPFATDFDPDYAGEFETDPTSSNGLDSGSTYAWVGVMEVYLTTPSSQLSTQNGGGADAAVFMKIDGDTIAAFDTPEFIDAEAMSIARINLFLQRDNITKAVYNYYQILPDMRLYESESDFRAVTDGGQLAQSVINVRGRSLD